MDKEPPPDFDPSSLIDDPNDMDTPSDRCNKDQKHKRAPDDMPAALEDLLPMIHSLPSPVKKLLFTGSCCAGVAVLYSLSAWDHGWIPGVESSFAKAEEVQNLKTDVTEMYVLSLATAIRDLTQDNCTLQSRVIDEQIIALRRRYKARTGDEYPHTLCKKASLDEGTKG